MNLLHNQLYLVAAGAALTFGTTASASDTNGFGKIEAINATNTGAELFTLKVSGRSAVPTCAANRPNRWAIDASTLAGQAAVTTLLWAADHGKGVWVTGTGTCSVWQDTETVALLTVEDELEVPAASGAPIRHSRVRQ